MKNVVVEMHIPISFNQGGKWKIGVTTADFPKEKPAKPHLYQGHASSLRISNYEGCDRTGPVETPEYSFLELSDNREWNWPIFNFRCATPLADPQGTDLFLQTHRSGTRARRSRWWTSSANPRVKTGRKK